jgi:hypothetical protein
MARMSEKSEGYNGWKNYETWAVALWIDNEEPLYRESRRMARNAKEEAEECPEEELYGQPRARKAVHYLADSLKEWIEEMQPALGASLWADLMGAAMSEVDWHEIAENFLSDLSE